MPSPRKLLGQQKKMETFSKVANAVSLLAATGMRRTKGPLEAAQNYVNRLSHMMRTLLSDEGILSCIADRTREQRSALVVVLGSDKGLCGGYHANLTKVALPHIAELRENVPQIQTEVFGKRTARLLRAHGMPADTIHARDAKLPTMEQILPDADRYWEAFQGGQVDRVDIAYTHYANATDIRPVVETLLPIEPPIPGEPVQQKQKGMDFYPSREELLTDMLLPFYRTRLYALFLESLLCEQKARMERMNGAKTSAKNRAKKLAQKYRRARQGKITGELQELTGGADAVSDQ